MTRHTLLRTTLESVAPLTDGEWAQLEIAIESQSFPSGSFLQRAGEGCRSIFFLEEGLVREYYTRENGSERTRSFARTGHFTSSYADFLLDRNAQVSIQALQPTRAWALSLKSLNDLRRSKPVLETLSHRFLEQMYIQKEKREYQFLTMTPTERYRRLAEDFPSIERVVQQYHLASYLGITPVALSRIRGRSRSKR